MMSGRMSQKNPEKMRAVMLHGPGDFRLESGPLPEIAAQDVLLRVRACGICGSDLAYVADGGLGGPCDAPMPLGHELSGVIEAVGSEVRDWRPGMRVVVNPMAGENSIGNGGPEGGFADYLCVRNVAGRAGAGLLELPEQISFVHGALVEPLAVAMHAVNQGGARAGMRAAVFGVGPIGLGAVAILKGRGVEHVAAVDLSERRLTIAGQMGADLCLHGERDQVFEALGAAHGTRDIYGAPTVGTELFIVAAGVPGVLKQVLQKAGPGARIVIVGLFRQAVEVDFLGLLMRELQIVGAIGYPSEFPDVIGMLQRREINISPMVGELFPLDDFSQAFATAQDVEHGGKVMVDISLEDRVS